MRNPYCRRTKISTSKFREIIRYFCTDLEATKTALLSGVERKNINQLFQKFRQRIAQLAELESPFETGEIEVEESYFGARRVRGKSGRGAAGKTLVFGMKKRGDKVYTQVVKNCSAAQLVPIIKRLAPDDSVIYSDEWKAYDGLVNAGYKKHYRVKHSDDIFANGKAHVNGIENFWGLTKVRLMKFRGLRGASCVAPGGKTLPRFLRFGFLPSRCAATSFVYT